RVAVEGLAAGLALAPAAASLVANRLEGVAPAGPAIYAGVAALLLAVVLLACALPARRAARLDPLVTLRCE
ncbi:MAG: hypothetical protein AB7N90_03560, partial [Vicinamibacterales bacterium]